MLGYSVCVRIAPSEFSGRADVEINHVHGFLPQKWRETDPMPSIVLSERSYRARRSEIDKGWPSFVAHRLYSKAGLFMGMSGNDGAVLDVLNRANLEIQRPVEYTGYWLMTPRAYEKNAKQIVDIGMCPVKLEKERIPDFLLKVCQAAAHG